jgi:hypothetical protein
MTAVSVTNEIAGFTFGTGLTYVLGFSFLFHGKLKSWLLNETEMPSANKQMMIREYIAVFLRLRWVISDEKIPDRVSKSGGK